MDWAFAAARAQIRKGLERTARDAHKRALAGFASTVPRKWFRVLGIFRERIAGEPVQQRLTPEEWEAELASMTFPPPAAEDVAAFLDHKGPGGLAWDERLASWESRTRDLIHGELGKVDAFNWTKKVDVAVRRFQDLLDEYDSGYEEFYEEFRRAFNDPRRFTYTPLICCRGEAVR